MALERFRYSLIPLESPERQIRLLSIEASRDQSRIEYKLQTHQLGSPKHFYALSYEWGPENPTENILINGMAFKVRANLKAFLDRIYSPDEEFIRPLWIDAICIDQNNLAERNSQVKIMGDIFAQAELVFTWLGTQVIGNGALTKVAGALEEYQRSNEFKLLQGSRGKDEEMQRLMTTSAPSIFSLNEPYASIWTCINRMAELPFWFRLWIVQEAVQAKKLLLLWGDEEISWTALSVAFQTLEMSTTSRRNSQHGLRPWDLVTNSIPYKVWQHKEGGHDHFLLEVMETYRESKCSVPHDKAYALRGICTDADLLQIDYDKSLDDLYVDLMSLLTSKEQCLRYSHLLLEALQLDVQGLNYSSNKKPLRGQTLSCEVCCLGQIIATKEISVGMNPNLVENEVLEMMAVAAARVTMADISANSRWVEQRLNAMQELTGAIRQTTFYMFWLSTGSIGLTLSKALTDDMVYSLPGLADGDVNITIRVDGARSPMLERSESWTSAESPLLSSPSLSSVFSESTFDTTARVWVTEVPNRSSFDESQKKVPLVLSLRELVTMNPLLNVELITQPSQGAHIPSTKATARRAQSDNWDKRSRRSDTTSNSIDQALRVGPGRMTKSSTWPSPGAGQVFIDALSRDLREKLFLSEQYALNIPE